MFKITSYRFINTDPQQSKLLEYLVILNFMSAHFGFIYIYYKLFFLYENIFDLSNLISNKKIATQFTKKKKKWKY